MREGCRGLSIAELLVAAALLGLLALPGLRWLDLAPDGSFGTQVARVQGVSFSFDRDSAGYL
jgi:hypothetical protein